jgi:hypothetical protein
MKRRTFLKIGAATVAVGTAILNEAADVNATSQINAEPSLYHDWAVKFDSVTASVTKDTYNSFFNDRQRNHDPEGFLNYLLSGTDLPRCTKVDTIKKRNGYFGGMSITFTGVVFGSNTRQHSPNRFAGYEHTCFCLSSPDSMSGMHLMFSEKTAL